MYMFQSFFPSFTLVIIDMFVTILQLAYAKRHLQLHTPIWRIAYQPIQTLPPIKPWIAGSTLAAEGARQLGVRLLHARAVRLISHRG